MKKKTSFSGPVKNKYALQVKKVSSRGFSAMQKAIFAKNLSVMIKSGLPLVEALDITADSFSGKSKKIVQDIKKSVESGQNFNECLKQYPRVFSQMFINAVYAGEKSGSLEENLEHVAEQLRKEKELVNKIKSAMMYPIIILVATFLLGMGISFFILPKITPLFMGMGVDLPITTRFLIAFADVVSHYGVWLFFGIIFIILLLIWLSQQKFSHTITHGILLNIPAIKTVVNTSNVAKLCRTLGTLLKSGITLDEAVVITRDATENYYYRKALNDVVVRINSGVKLSVLLSEHPKYFPKLVTRMVMVGEESGRLEDSLFYLAEFYEAEVDNATKTLSTVVEPLLLVIIGAMVGFLALSIITPIYSITGSMGK